MNGHVYAPLSWMATQRFCLVLPLVETLDTSDSDDADEVEVAVKFAKQLHTCAKLEEIPPNQLSSTTRQSLLECEQWRMCESLQHLTIGK